MKYFRPVIMYSLKSFYFNQRTQAYEWMDNGYYFESSIGTNLYNDYTGQSGQAYADWNNNGLYYNSNVDYVNQAYAKWRESGLYYESNLTINTVHSVMYLKLFLVLWILEMAPKVVPIFKILYTRSMLYFGLFTVKKIHL